MNNRLIILLLLLINHTLFAQQKIIFQSELLPAADTVLVFKPATYKKTTAYPVVYLLHGYSSHFRQWSNTTNLQQLADHYGFIIVTPEGFVNWYLESPIDPHSRFTTFFFKELAPRIAADFHVDDKNIFISGLSMGGHGALLTFLQQPDFFRSAGATSGAVELNKPALAYAAHYFQLDQVIPDIEKVAGQPDSKSQSWEAFSVYHLVDKLKGTNKTIIFDCGSDDPLYNMNNNLKQKLDALGIPSIYIAQPGKHDTAYWSKSILHHFAFFNTQVSH